MTRRDENAEKVMQENVRLLQQAQALQGRAASVMREICDTRERVCARLRERRELVACLNNGRLSVADGAWEGES